MQLKYLKDYRLRRQRMIIETNPCASCDLCPSFCGVDIEMCQMACEPLPNIEKKRADRRYEEDGL